MILINCCRSVRKDLKVRAVPVMLREDWRQERRMESCREIEEDVELSRIRGEEKIIGWLLRRAVSVLCLVPNPD